MSQEKILELKQDQLIIQREQVREKIKNLERLEDQLSAKIENLSKQRENLRLSRERKASRKADKGNQRIPESNLFANYSQRTE